MTPGAYFNLYSYEVRGNTNENTKFTVTSQAGSPSLTSAPDNNTTTGFNSSEDYVLFRNLKANNSGVITENFTNGGGSVFGATNGFQLVSVPAPAAVVGARR